MRAAVNLMLRYPSGYNRLVSIRKVLIANRGEIAVRIIRACREMGVASVAIYSDADRSSLHVRMADEAAHIGPSESIQSYLSIDRILAAAKRHGADSIHPGYGFLSENAEFSQACTDAGLTFIGPSAETIRLMGSKPRARRVAQHAGVPVLPGTSAGVSDLREAGETASEIGYPVLIKAADGGGGKGMRRVQTAGELDSALLAASGEARRAFGSGSVYIEKLLERPRHIEIQVLGDRFGHLIHLGERECSIQRRHQKVIEECPSPLLERYPDLREQMGAAAVKVARETGYYNAGTVEFLVDATGQFYFLEMNTRLQVEHPVTELATGLDLVHWQFRIAEGEALTLSQDQVRWRGAAIECRIYAEDPAQDFFPSPGTITHLSMPAGPGVRLDSGVYQGWTVPVEYDPLLAKLAVWGETRPIAISRMQRAISECRVGGITTNLSLFEHVLRDSEFLAGDLHTDFIPEWQTRHARGSFNTETEMVAALVATWRASFAAPVAGPSPGTLSPWLTAGRAGLVR